MDDDRGVFELLFDVNGPPVFPPGALVVATAVISTSSPHVSRPFRHFGRWLIASQVIAALFVQAAVPSGAIAAVAIGTLSAAIIHLVAGSPGGRPTESRIRLALAELGVYVDELAPAAMQSAGVVLFEGRDRTRSAARQGLRARRLGCPAAHLAVAQPVVPRRRARPRA